MVTSALEELLLQVQVLIYRNLTGLRLGVTELTSFQGHYYMPFALHFSLSSYVHQSLLQEIQLEHQMCLIVSISCKTN